MNEQEPQLEALGADDPPRRRFSKSVWRLILISLGVMVALGVAASASMGGAISVMLLVVTLVVVAVVVVSALAIQSQSTAKGARLQTAEAFCDERDLEYFKRDPGDVKRTFRAIPEVKSGGSIKHVMKGELAERSFVAFEHSYMIHTGQATVPVVRTIFTVETPNWPRVDMAPTHMLTRFFHRLFGKRGLQLDLPEFNRQIRVRTAEPDFALTLLSPDLQRHILDKPNVTWRLVDGRLCLIYNGAMKFDRAPESMRRIERFLELVPPELEYWTSAASA